MGYKHIDNLYKNQTILMLKRCYALEKIHGTSARVVWKDGQLTFKSGGEKHTKFVTLFDVDDLRAKFEVMGHDDVQVYGEAYGGKCQRMSDTYGKELKFAAFEVQIGETWLNVTNAADVVGKLGLEFVYFTEISTDIEAVDAQRDDGSVQAIRNGMGPGLKREGVVLRPLQEITDNRGNRIVCKHKRDDFSEVRTPRKVSPEKLAVLSNAEDVAMEWVTDMRLRHVLDKFPGACMEQMRDIISAMVEDVTREGEGEISGDKKAIQKAIGSRTVKLFKGHLMENLIQGEGE